jgi:hypothetical protein
LLRRESLFTDYRWVELRESFDEAGESYEKLESLVSSVREWVAGSSIYGFGSDRNVILEVASLNCAATLIGFGCMNHDVVLKRGSVEERMDPNFSPMTPVVGIPGFRDEHSAGV